MVATGAYVHFTAVTCTPTLPSGSPVTISKVTGIKRMAGGKIIKLYADGGSFSVVNKRVEEERTVSIQTAATNLSSVLAPNTLYTLSWVEKDAKNGTGSGAITVTVVNCSLKSQPSEIKSNAFADASLEFDAAADTGDTDPMTYVVAA